MPASTLYSWDSKSTYIHELPYFKGMSMSPGVKAVIAKSFERTHCASSLGEDADTLGLTGHERFTLDLPNCVRDIRPGQDVTLVTDSGKSFVCQDVTVALQRNPHWAVVERRPMAAPPNSRTQSLFRGPPDTH
ncbi:hypothetical protein SAY86_017605 [Trapa natans]|uniref:Uncharacterized protein n=1 Tax=Trapa natans TaxID=22666 RepID=A0AAN7LPL7_TRANT|nr:hypothetical protein SAY86_017605 [Trapa natans]